MAIKHLGGVRNLHLSVIISNGISYKALYANGAFKKKKKKKLWKLAAPQIINGRPLILPWHDEKFF